VWHGRGLDPYPKNKDGTPWVYQAPPEKKPERSRQPHGLAEAAASAKALGGHVCQVGIPCEEYVECAGVVTATALEAKILRHFAPGYDVSQNAEALGQLREHLMAEGFTAAPNSVELVEMVGRIAEQDIDALRRSPMPPGVRSWRVVDACIAQLRRTLPSTSIVLGLYKARARTCREDNASSLHKDDVLLTEGEVTKALFPLLATVMASNEEGGFFHRYKSFCADANRSYPSLQLPSCPIDRGVDLGGLTRELICSIRRYNEEQSDREEELVLDNVNVWIPRDTKQILVLPLAYSRELPYPLSSGHVETLKGSFADKFQALPKGAALVFFGQSLLHQALIGHHFDCGSGSLEGRYLVLTPRRHARRGSLRDQLGLMNAEVASDDLG